jgi:hypothetical protein
MDGYADDTGGKCPICGHDHLDHEPDKSDFKDTIKTLFLELVGEDELSEHYTVTNSTGVDYQEDNNQGRNDLRAELREKINKL